MILTTILMMILMVILMMILMIVVAGTEDRSQEEPYTFPPLGEGVRTNFRDLDPVWERERERLNRDALKRLKTPGGVGGLCNQ